MNPQQERLWTGLLYEASDELDEVLDLLEPQLPANAATKQLSAINWNASGLVVVDQQAKLIDGCDAWLIDNLREVRKPA